MTGCIIQASRYGWDGTEDYSVRKLKGKLVIEHVLDKVKSIKGIDSIVLAVPDDEGSSIFKRLAEDYGVICHPGPAGDVLERLKGAVERSGADIIMKTLGQNCFLDTNLAEGMIGWLCSHKDTDFLQAPDDFETKFSCEVFSADLLRQIESLLKGFQDSERSRYLARPISFVKANKNLFKTAVYREIPVYDREYLLSIRDQSIEIYGESQSTGYNGAKQVEAGNFWMERYKFVSKYINKDDKVLDIACGTAFGTEYIFRNITTKITGTDISQETITRNKATYPHIDFSVADAVSTGFQDNAFDKVVSIETLEHIEIEKVEAYLKEMHRILKPGGLFLCTTPQNSNGEIPVVPWHVKEYSLREFKSLLSSYFELEKVYGSKNGIISDDESGNGMIGICRKKSI